ncbi:Mu transposase C-terminal domain-containing protein [Streptosporangium sp. NPDC051023]|uniref:Mu transposase C-terminal domain-containing protein n=1 Tax=Streptosporangium sp. NPDC051023 TaxID=3155410 RepID=UPI00344C8C4B
MSVSRPASIQIGDRIRLGEAVHTVTGFEGTLVHLVDHRGALLSLPVSRIQATVGFEILGKGQAAPLNTARVLEGMSAETAETALWWERHLIEVINGTRPDASSDAPPRPQYDPACRSLAEREQAKADELARLGHAGVSLHTIRRKRLRYQARGLAGVVDQRTERRTTTAGRTDERVVQAIRQLVEENVTTSTRTGSYYFWKVERLLIDKHGPGTVMMPSRATFYRLFDKLITGRHITGSARTRRSLANRPDGPFNQLAATRPGEFMEIDSTPLDVLVLLDEGVPGRVELTGVVDLATRTITAAVLSPTTKSVDAALLLARTLTPEPMRPGWAQALRLTRSVLPYRHLIELDQRLEQAAARPVIVPETIVCDQGNVYISRNFRSACAALGISYQPAHLGTPTDKPHIERSIESVGTLFCQFVSGYVGPSADRRGEHVEQEPLWSIHELQGLLEEWLVSGWQNRPHDGLRDPAAPGRAFTPNEKYAALVRAAGYVPVALSADDYIELLPATWRSINSYGIKIKHRKYDCAELSPFRRQHSGITSKKGLWEVHRDPYDVSRIWVRNHWDGGWITVPWTHLRSTAAPFGDLAWDHARKELDRAATETEIAQAVNDLLERAGKGPERAPALSAKDRRVAAKTRATAKPSVSSGPVLPPQSCDRDHPEEPEHDARVIPLPVFDARKEAEKWW